MILWLLMTLQVFGSSPNGQLATRFLDRGNPRLAMRSLRSALSPNPDDDSLMSIYAVASAMPDCGLMPASLSCPREPV